MSRINALDVVASLAAIWLSWKIYSSIRDRGKVRTTALNGPPNPSRLFGMSRTILDAEDSSALYEGWAETYGLAYSIPSALGRQTLVLMDPKAVASFYARETTVFTQTKISKMIIEKMLGYGLLSSEGDDHKRQRKSLTPAFSIGAVRKHTSVFYDSAFQAKDAWEALITAGAGDGSAVIEVQEWMNRISLDSIGIAGFSHDFGALKGVRSPIYDMFDSFGNVKPSVIGGLLFALSLIFPVLTHLPTERNVLLKRLRSSTSEIATELLRRARNEKMDDSDGQRKAEQSIIGLLIKGEGVTLSADEVIAQMSVLILAGYETTSISLTWALIELSRHQDMQTKLRQELLEFGIAEPTWEQLNNDLPYLDHIVHETLRLHPPLGLANRVAMEDTVIPLTEPIVTRTGETVSQLILQKGQGLTIPIHTMNRSEVFWGPTAREFIPDRWAVDPSTSALRAAEIQGHRHLLTFADGPRICLGKNFALVEFKAVLSVLIRNFSFELPEGVETDIGKHGGSILPRPKVAGLDGPKVPLRVRRAEL